VGWIFVLSALASAAGIFLPSIHVPAAHTSRAAVSLYEVATHRALATRLIAAYHMSRGRALGEALTQAIVQHSKNEYVGDANDALTSLDEVSDRDVKTLGIVFAGVIWAFLAVQAVTLLLVVGSLAGDVHRKRRFVVVAALSALGAAIAIALLVVCREAVWQANDDVGYAVLGVGPGVYWMAAASALGLVAAVTRAVARHRG
jgi:hypothetical protein